MLFQLLLIAHGATNVGLLLIPNYSPIFDHLILLDLKGNKRNYNLIFNSYNLVLI